MTMELHGAFNNLDYIVLSVILLSGFLALMRGFVREMFSLVAWIGAYIVGTKFYAPAVPLVRHYIPKNEAAAKWVAMGSVFVISLILLTIIGYFISMLVRGRALTAIDRSLGFLYGLARGVVVVSLVYLCAVNFIWPDIDAPSSQRQEDKDHRPLSDLLVKAKTRPLLAFSADMLKKLVPQDMIDEKIKDVEKQKRNMEQNMELEQAVPQQAPDAAAAPEMSPAAVGQEKAQDDDRLAKPEEKQEDRQ